MILENQRLNNKLRGLQIIVELFPQIHNFIQPRIVFQNIRSNVARVRRKALIQIKCQLDDLKQTIITNFLLNCRLRIRRDLLMSRIKRSNSSNSNIIPKELLSITILLLSNLIIWQIFLLQIPIYKHSTFQTLPNNSINSKYKMNTAIILTWVTTIRIHLCLISCLMALHSNSKTCKWWIQISSHKIFCSLLSIVEFHLTEMIIYLKALPLQINYLCINNSNSNNLLILI